MASRSADPTTERSTGSVLPFGPVVAIVAGAVIAFGVLASLVFSESSLVRFDAVAHDTLFRALGESRQGGLAVTWFGNNDTLVAFVVLTAGALALRHRVWLALRVLLASGVGGLVSLGLKAVFQRARPVDPVVVAEGFSFPSGHALASTVFYGMLIYLSWRLATRVSVRLAVAAVSLALIIAVGLSRVYLNVHYLTDVIGGW
ncbi:MAG: phosphatase PAP2 family protein, partial [Bacteroidota bacterium]